MENMNDYYGMKLLTEQIVATIALFGMMGYIIYLIGDEIITTENKLSVRTLLHVILILIPTYAIYWVVNYWIGRIV